MSDAAPLYNLLRSGVQAGQVAAGRAVPPAVWAASALVGTTVASVLFCSHFHQIEGDAAAGKLSPLVRLGPERGLQVGRCCCRWFCCVKRVADRLASVAVLQAGRWCCWLPSQLLLLLFSGLQRSAPASPFRVDHSSRTGIQTADGSIAWRSGRVDPVTTPAGYNTITLNEVVTGTL